MPHAIERSVATPTMRARLPARNPIHEPRLLTGKNRKRFFRYRACVSAGKKRGFCRLLPSVATPGRFSHSAAARGYADREFLARLDGAADGDVVPVEDLRHRDLEHTRD